MRALWARSAEPGGAHPRGLLRRRRAALARRELRHKLVLLPPPARLKEKHGLAVTYGWGERRRT